MVIRRPSFYRTSAVGIWRLDAGSGTTAKDSSGERNDGTLKNGPTWVSGKVGKALDFDGSDDYVKLPDGFLPKNPDEFTVNVWSYHETPNDGDDDLDITLHNNWWMLLGDAGDGTYWFHFAGDTDADYYAPMEANKWTMWTMWFSESKDEVRFYKNGEFLDSKSASGLGTAGWDNCIGANWHSNDRFVDGTVDEVRIYDRALSTKEIKAMYRGARFLV